MAEEFEQSPKSLQKMSSTLVHNRKTRTAFICGVIIIMSLASSSSLVFTSNNDEKIADNNTKLSSMYLDQPMPDINIIDNSRSLVFEDIPQEIVMKLYLTVHHNVTINNNNGSICSDACIKQVIENLGLDNENVSLTDKKIIFLKNHHNR